MFQFPKTIKFRLFETPWIWKCAPQNGPGKPCKFLADYWAIRAAAPNPPDHRLELQANEFCKVFNFRGVCVILIFELKKENKCYGPGSGKQNFTGNG